MPFNLIVPIASYKSEYLHSLPAVFIKGEDGLMPCIKAVLSLDFTLFDHIFFTILRIMEEKHHLCALLKEQFHEIGLAKAEIIILDNPTLSQPETIYQTILQANIKGSIFIKDADCSFCGEILPQNGVVIYPLESLKWVNPQNKSYVAVDDHFYVTNIIEKKIISHYFLAGGYCFEDLDLYCRYYQRFAGQKGLYLSHIIYSMLLDKYSFRPILATEYTDFETLVQL
ncbi:MAG: hypothetical protein K6A36_06245 [Paludibacteraceae bacterium]|nr:hypothetical protein [Paludibacteraceae bacterium]